MSPRVSLPVDTLLTKLSYLCFDTSRSSRVGYLLTLYQQVGRMVRSEVTDICQVATTSLIQTVIGFHISNLESLAQPLKDLDEPVNEWRAQLSAFLLEASNNFDPTSLNEQNAAQVLGISDDTYQALSVKDLDVEAGKYHIIGFLV